MSTRPLIGLLLALLLSFCLGGIVVWKLTATRAPAPSSPSMPTTTPAPDAEPRSRAERFFGGDPDRDVRGGQEMKPRW